MALYETGHLPSSLHLRHRFKKAHWDKAFIGRKTVMLKKDWFLLLSITVTFIFITEWEWLHGSDPRLHLQSVVCIQKPTFLPLKYLFCCIFFNVLYCVTEPRMILFPLWRNVRTRLWKASWYIVTGRNRNGGDFKHVKKDTEQYDCSLCSWDKYWTEITAR